jgi:hypothetical protein
LNFRGTLSIFAPKNRDEFDRSTTGTIRSAKTTRELSRAFVDAAVALSARPDPCSRCVPESAVSVLILILAEGNQT